MRLDDVPAADTTNKTLLPTNSIDLTPVLSPSTTVKIEIDAVVRLLDDFRGDADVIAA